MSFHGVLLRVAEGEEENGAFRVVAPDAEMGLPAQHQRLRSKLHENALSASAGQVLVVTDHVSSRLLQVAGCAAVLLQRETHSALWVAALASQKAATLVESTSRAVQQQNVGSRALPLQQLSLNAWDHSSNNGGDGANGGGILGDIAAGRSCYCFQFRSSVEFDMFERTIQAYQRVQKMSLLENSVLMEMEIEQELVLKNAAARASSVNDAIIGKRGARTSKSGAKTPDLVQERPMTRDELRAAARLLKSRTQGSTTAMSRSIQKNRTANGGGDTSAITGAKGGAPAVRGRARPAEVTTPRHAPTDPNVRCILCTNSQAQTTKPLSKHPFVLQDARGEDCYVCQVCMQQLLKRRVQNQAFPTPGKIPTETVCALCAEPETTFTHALKKCVHPNCPRLYCTACLHKLVGKARTHKVWRTRLWYCPCCTNYDATVNSTEEEAANQGTTTETVAADMVVDETADATNADADDQARKKRKRRTEASATDETDAKQQEPTTAENDIPPGMGPVDYAANYFQFLIQRELAKSPQDESEDVCFCCKDGGELIECDWPGDDLKYARCPKVYHEDCLGYKVPENFVWKCPRHRCQACGIIAMFSCRFCVTSYCSDHVPDDIKKIGPAPRDIVDSTYVVCQTCEQNAQRALGERKLSTKIHALLYRLPGKRAGAK